MLDIWEKESQREEKVLRAGAPKKLFRGCMSNGSNISKESSKAINKERKRVGEGFMSVL